MRDAFGGAFMIKIFIVFIFVYICLTAMALNYAKAFKVKNAVIEYLESNEIIDLNNITAEQMNAIDEYFNNEVLGNITLPDGFSWVDASDTVKEVGSNHLYKVLYTPVDQDNYLVEENNLIKIALIILNKDYLSLLNLKEFL